MKDKHSHGTTKNKKHKPTFSQKYAAANSAADAWRLLAERQDHGLAATGMAPDEMRPRHEQQGPRQRTYGGGFLGSVTACGDIMGHPDMRELRGRPKRDSAHMWPSI
jgi:hypothetical protein